MPATSSLNASQLVQRIQQADLIDAAVLQQTLESLEKSSTENAGVLCQRLIDAGLLTRWQCDRLLEGRRKFLLGKYRLLDQLGRGGMSRVYLAEHTVMHRRVAIKLLSPQHAADPEYLGRFFVEARAVASLDHPHVVRAYDVDQVDNYHFLVMEYLEGRDVYDIVAQEGPLESHVAAHYIQQAADGLAHAHEAGLIHRDVKPGNLFVDKSGRLKVLDLGLAYFTTEPRVKLPDTDDEMIVGTVDFIAPEQALGREVNARTDIYGLGATLYYMLTGTPPFPEGTVSEKLQQHISAQPKPILEVNPHASRRLVAICKRMMSKSPKTRYQSMEEVREVITAYLNGKAINSAGNVVEHSDLDVEELTLAPKDDLPRKPPMSPRPANKPASSTKAPVARDTKPMTAGGPLPTRDVSPQIQLPDSAVPSDINDLLTCDLRTLDRSPAASPKPRPQPIALPQPLSPKKSGMKLTTVWLIVGAVVLVVAVLAIAAMSLR